MLALVTSAAKSQPQHDYWYVKSFIYFSIHSHFHLNLTGILALRGTSVRWFIVQTTEESRSWGVLVDSVLFFVFCNLHTCERKWKSRHLETDVPAAEGFTQEDRSKSKRAWSKNSPELPHISFCNRHHNSTTTLDRTTPPPPVRSYLSDLKKKNTQPRVSELESRKLRRGAKRKSFHSHKPLLRLCLTNRINSLFIPPAFPDLSRGRARDLSAVRFFSPAHTVVSLLVWRQNQLTVKLSPQLKRELTLSVLIWAPRLISHHLAQFTFCEVKAWPRFTDKNTCLRLYLAWLDHNRDAKIVGPAPAVQAQWMVSVLSHSASDRQVLNLATRLASITSLSASRISPPPRAHHWIKLGRWLKNTRLVIGWWASQL